jgi:Zn-dependent peptidase ImmA (M78 family)
VRELLAKAAEYGLEVHGSHLPHPKVGSYIPELQRVYFDLSLTMPWRRSVIAHEIGHAHHGHLCDSTVNEKQADAFAAHLLVEPEWYAELEQISHDANWIGEEMNVAPYVIEDYRRYCLQRLGSATYARARMGAGQWEFRA